MIVAKEIERKFLVDKSYLNYISRVVPNPESIKQSYLFSKNGYTARIRVGDLGSYLTFKGPTTGISRLEFEIRIPRFIGKMLLGEKYLHKFRYSMPMMSLGTERPYDIWEIDVFSNLNRENLIIAEIEVPYERYPLILPDIVKWTDEVSHDPQYYNSNLIKEVK